MNLRYFFLLTFTLPCLFAFGFDSNYVFQNRAFKSDLLSIQAMPSDLSVGYPFINLNSGQQLLFQFDQFGEEINDFNYSIVHCSHDWKKSDVTALEYLEGFERQLITDYDYSFNTIHSYVHYSFLFPNDLSKLKISGNYSVIVYTGNDPEDQENWVITYRMVAYQDLIQINGAVKSSSNISRRYTAQEVDFDLVPSFIPVYDPMANINVSIIQNGDWEHSVNRMKPIFIMNDRLTFDYNDINIFDAAAEFRVFENKDLRIRGIEVDGNYRAADGYQTVLLPDLMAGKAGYSTNRELNGRYFIQNDMGGEADLESEYTTVEFYLQGPELPGEVYIEGDLTKFNRELGKCIYNKASGRYECQILLKQGYYNYRYVVLNDYVTTPDYSYTEGNYHQTENDYHIIVYYYDRNAGCDLVIGVRALNSVY